MIIGKPVIKVAVMDEDMQQFAVEKAQEAMLVMYHEQVSQRVLIQIEKLQK
jgi:hypothetical protein